MGDLLDDIEESFSDIPSGESPTDRDDIYDAPTEFEDPEDVELAPPDPVERSLDAEGWGLRGEGTPAAVDSFVSTLNSGMFGDIPVKIRPKTVDWGPAHLGYIRGKQAERGKALFAEVDMDTESFANLQGRIGSDLHGGTAESFLASNRPNDVQDYADRFRDGDRPGAFGVELDTDGEPTRHQEGRHRALAARRAGLEWVPVVVLRKTEGFRRLEKRRKDDGPGYWSNY